MIRDIAVLSEDLADLEEITTTPSDTPVRSMMYMLPMCAKEGNLVASARCN